MKTVTHNSKHIKDSYLIRIINSKGDSIRLEFADEGEKKIVLKQHGLDLDEAAKIFIEACIKEYNKNKESIPTNLQDS